VKLETGRTHQIRVHAAHAGHPIVGDQRYGDADMNRRMRKFGAERLFLHAASLAFELAGSAPCHFSSPLPDDLRAVIDALEKRGRHRTPRSLERAARQGRR
jgi:23S rRNA pseudouridine955/2504/2580 synthase